VNEREQRGLLIAAYAKIKRKGGVLIVPSQENAAKKYTVCPDEQQPHCSCPDHETRGCVCKHIYAVRIVIQRELFDDGTTIETREVTVTETRQTYPQNWTAYNLRVLQGLFDDVQPPLRHRLARSPRARLHYQSTAFQ
jgi:hypothetical protein